MNSGRGIRAISGLGLALALALLGPGSLWAQPAQDETEEAPAAQRIIEEVVVSATKREKSLREIPASVSAVSGEALEESAAQGMEDYMTLMPGVSMNQGVSGGDSSRVTVRGLGLDTVNAITANPVGIFIEDAAFTDPFLAYVSPDMHPFDLKSVEVLKGPQGTLFGGSALTGLVRYTLEPAHLDGWEAKFMAMHSVTEEGGASTNYGVAVNVPVTDNLAVRVMGLHRNGGGVIDEQLRGEDDVDTRRQEGGRLLLYWNPTDKFELALTSLRQFTDMPDLGFSNDPDGARTRDNTPTPSPSVTEFGLDNLRLNYSFGWADLVSSTSVLSKEIDSRYDLTRLANNNEAPPGANEALLFTTIDVESDGILQEFRLVSTGEGPWEWLVGAFAQRYELDAFTETGGGVPYTIPILEIAIGTEGLGALTSPVGATVKELALFGDVTRDLGEHWEVNLGLRAYRIQTNGASNTFYAGVQVDRLEADIPESGLNPKLAVTWYPTEDLQVYATASKGFRYGGVQVIVPLPTDDVPPTYKSDTVWNYEIGLRTDWLENTLQADLTAYFIDWTDAQYTQFPPSGLFQFVDNIASARSVGVEGTLVYLPPIDGLTLSLAASYIDARTAAPFEDANGDTIPSGTRLPGTARVQTAFVASYRRQIGPWALGSRISHAYLSSGFNDLQHSYRTLGFRDLDFSFNVGRPDLRMSPALSLAVTNVLNDDNLANVYNALEAVDYYYTRPRTVSLTLSANF
mgnify:CR=1 FL=1